MNEARDGAPHRAAPPGGRDPLWRTNAIPLLVVKDVIAVPEITRVPFSLPHFLGIKDLRGQIISERDLLLQGAAW